MEAFRSVLSILGVGCSGFGDFSIKKFQSALGLALKGVEGQEFNLSSRPTSLLYDYGTAVLALPHCYTAPQNQAPN